MSQRDVPLIRVDLARMRRNPGHANCPIFKLPAELQNLIWTLVVAGSHRLSADRPYPHLPGVLRTCYCIRKEAFGIWRARTFLAVEVRDCDAAFLYDKIQPALAWILRSARYLGVSPTATAPCIYARWIGLCSWTNLVQSLRVFHAERGLGFERDRNKNPGRLDPGRQVTAAASFMANLMQERDWCEVEQALAVWHTALASMDRRWRKPAVRYGVCGVSGLEGLSDSPSALLAKADNRVRQTVVLVWGASRAGEQGSRKKPGNARRRPTKVLLRKASVTSRRQMKGCTCPPAPI
ncbi:hypothetical protein LTR53_017121 [Teratosphaeriaceae sp. CCFEE 6253]|nr:hypothetical protein LTR53_017121 [Teratosphaeriaceae sp. CCFEE 6253]